jgi:hypothetical protein
MDNMHKPHVLALTGGARTGKDTVGNYLVEKYGYTRIAFADPIKQCVLALNPEVRIEHFDHPDVVQYATYAVYPYMRVADIVQQFGWEIAKEVKEVRIMLQRMGTEVGRDIITPALDLESSLWIEIAEKKVDTILFNGPVVITDERFDDEAGFVWNYEEGKNIRLTNPNAPAVASHSSENGVDSGLIDIELVNDGTLEDLYKKVDDIFLGQ